MVYYGDAPKSRPQRHRLADCARIRASTPGMADIPCYEHNLSDDDAIMSEENATPLIDNTLEQHVLSDCNFRASKKVAFSTIEHVLEDCEGGTSVESSEGKISSGHLFPLITSCGPS
jgi:hypothetical protein